MSLQYEAIPVEYWEVTTPLGVTVEKTDYEPWLENGLVKFLLDGKVQVIYNLRHVINIGRITEDDYNEFRRKVEPQEATFEEDDDGDDQPKTYKDHISTWMNG